MRRELGAMLKFDLYRMRGIFYTTPGVILYWFVFSHGAEDPMSFASTFLTMSVIFIFSLETLAPHRVFYDILLLRRRVVTISYYLTSLMFLVLYGGLAAVVLGLRVLLGMDAASGWVAMTPSSLGAAVLSYAVLAPVSVHYGYLMRAIFEYGYITGLFVFIITVATVMVGGWAALSAMPDSWLMANFPEWRSPLGAVAAAGARPGGLSRLAAGVDLHLRSVRTTDPCWRSPAAAGPGCSRPVGRDAGLARQPEPPRMELAVAFRARHSHPGARQPLAGWSVGQPPRPLLT